jgi:two-component system cell cycle response regulator
VTERRGLIGLAAGLLGLALGGLAALSDIVLFAVLAGALALVAGVAAYRLWQMGREAQHRVSELTEKVDELEHEKARAAEERDAAQLRHEAALADRIRNRAVREGGNGTDSLTDAETGLFSEAYFLVAVDARIAVARRHLRPVAIVLLEIIEGLTDKPHPAEPQEVAGSLQATLREADTACRLSDGTYGLLLEDTPENGAIWTVERLRRQMTQENSELTLWAGVSCYPAHGFDPPELVEAASTALEHAREWRQDRIEVATASS